MTVSESFPIPPQFGYRQKRPCLLCFRSRRIVLKERMGMSANLEKAIQDEVRDLTDDQQRQVMAFVESLKPKPSDGRRRYSFVGIAHSGKGSLSSEAP